MKELIVSRSEIDRRKLWNLFFQVVSLFVLAGAIFVLLILILDLARTGVERLSLDFLMEFPSRFANKAGILSAWVGSLCVMVTTACVAIPLGIAAGVYLEEYAPKNWVTSIIEINITNLAGVPSIIFGLMALGLFVHKLDLGRSILSAGLTLGLLVLPIIIVTTREALRSIPLSVREAAYGVGSTRWQLVRYHLVPYSLGGILTGIIISLSRALGETAPLITIGALTYIPFLPPAPIQTDPALHLSTEWLFSPFTVLPIQMFNWVSRPDPAFRVAASATGIVLLVVTLVLNGLAIWIRYRFRKRIKW